MADFATPGASHESNFANAERREVVVQHEALGCLGRIEQLNPLLIVFGAERRGDKRLSFAPRKNRRAMGTWEYADFAPDGTKFIELTTVRTPVLLQHLVAE